MCLFIYPVIKPVAAISFKSDTKEPEATGDRDEEKERGSVKL